MFPCHQSCIQINLQLHDYVLRRLILIAPFSVCQPEAGRQQEIVFLDPRNGVTDVAILECDLSVEPAIEPGCDRGIKGSAVLSGVAQIVRTDSTGLRTDKKVVLPGPIPRFSD